MPSNKLIGLFKSSSVASSATVPIAIAFSLLWSSAFIAGKTAIAYCPPLLLLSVRFLIAGPLLLLIARLLGQRLHFDRRLAVWIITLGLLNNTLYLGLSFTGLQTVPASIVVIIISSAPFMTAALARLMLGERLSVPASLGMIAGFFGVVVIVMPQPGSIAADSTGLLLTMAGALAFAVGTVLFKRAPVASVGLFALVGYQAIVGGLTLLPVAILLEDAESVHITSPLLQVLIYLVLAVSVGATMLWFFLVRMAHASIASTYHFLNPVFGMILGWSLLNESPTMHNFIGASLVIAGILVVTRFGISSSQLNGNESTT